MATLRVRLQGDLGNITLDALITALRETQAILEELDTAISGEKKGSLDWVVAGLREGSAELAISPRTRLADRDCGPEVIATYVTSVARLEQQAMTPPYLRETGIRRCQRVLRLIGREGVTGIVLVNEDDTRELYLTAQATVHAAQLLQVRHIALGSIDGTLEAISVHQKPRFTIYHSWTHKAVTCDFSSTDLLEQAKSALGGRVSVIGMVAINSEHEPVRVKAERLTAFAADGDLPTTASLWGSDPDFTGGLESVEYIRRMRDA